MKVDLSEAMALTPASRPKIVKKRTKKFTRSVKGYILIFLLNAKIFRTLAQSRFKT